MSFGILHFLLKYFALHFSRVGIPISFSDRFSTHTNSSSVSRLYFKLSNHPFLEIDAYQGKREAMSTNCHSGVLRLDSTIIISFNI